MKRKLAWLLIVLISIESPAAAVSDNDGSSFITSAEFDSMKNVFQTQINNYMANIDNKLDTAINEYINGIRQDTDKIENIIGTGEWYAVNTGYTAGSSDYTWRYKYGSPRVLVYKGKYGLQDNGTGTTNGEVMSKSSHFQASVLNPPPYEDDKHAQHKLCIEDINPTERTAAWVGIAYAANDQVNCYNVERTWSWSAFWGYNWSKAWYGPWRPYNNVARRGEFDDSLRLDWGCLGPSDGSIAIEWGWNSTALHQDWGTMGQRRIMLLAPKRYLNFSKYPKSRNWKLSRQGTTSTDYEVLWTDLTARNQPIPQEYLNCFATRSQWYDRAWLATQSAPYVWTNGVDFVFDKRFPNRSAEDEPVYGNSYSASYMYFLWPCVGFEDNYITNWNQLYNKYFDEIVKDNDLSSVRSRFLKDDSGNYHAGIVNGIPLVKSPKSGTKVSLELELKDPIIDVASGSETYQLKDSYVWISESPFTGWPNDNTDCLTLSSPDGSAVTTTEADFRRGIKVPLSSGGKCKIECTTRTNNQYLWIKWTCNGKSGGGIISLPETCKLTIPG